MPYFRPDTERYGGYDRAKELKNAQLPPDREPRDEDGVVGDAEGENEEVESEGDGSEEN